MTFTTDLIERAVRTFFQSALTVIAANLAGLTSIDAAKAVAVSAIAAGFSAVMSLMAMNVGPRDSASVVLPEMVGTPAETPVPPADYEE